MRIESWMLESPREPMVLRERDQELADDEVVVGVAGCGICHTDLGFCYEGVPTRHPLPLTLGHEISGTVVGAGPLCQEWLGRDVVVPAVIPCADCNACRDGQEPICPNQIFPGNDVHGGFATHVVVPARGLCPVPTDQEGGGFDLAALSVLADAITTPYQAILRSDLAPGDLAVFVGAGGVGGFGIQIAAALGAAVVAIDIDADRLELVKAYGADLCLLPSSQDPKALRKEITAFASGRDIPTWRWRIFETSGHPAGQETAFGLLRHGSSLSVVGYTPQKISLRLSNLMAFDAVAQGNWGCPPRRYPAALELVTSGQVHVEPFIERRPMAAINETFADLVGGNVTRRVVLLPEK